MVHSSLALFAAQPSTVTNVDTWCQAFSCFASGGPHIQQDGVHHTGRVHRRQPGEAVTACSRVCSFPVPLSSVQLSDRMVTLQRQSLILHFSSCLALACSLGTAWGSALSTWQGQRWRST